MGATTGVAAATAVEVLAKVAAAVPPAKPAIKWRRERLFWDMVILLV
jgi:hypothetical protein